MREGQLVAERFEIEVLAGAGGMGSVYRARDRTTGGLVALKLLHVVIPSEAQRLLREAKVLAAAQNPRIVRYVAHGTSGGEPYLAMEWLEGETLEDRLSRAQPLTLAESVTLGKRLAEALSFLHERAIIHRDIKPSNVFLPRGEVASAKLLDLGIAHMPTATRPSTRTGTAVGTPGYMPPEQARGHKDIDARADLFSLGCVLYECFTGKIAFLGDNVMAVLAKILFEESPRLHESRPNVPQELDDLVARLMAKEVEGRPKTAAEVLAVLSSVQVDDSPPCVVVPRPESEALTGGERRLVCVVMARPGAETVDLSNAPTVAAAHSGASIADRLLRVAAPFGAHVEHLPTGLVVATLADRVEPTLLVSRAAQCALALRRELPEYCMALSTGFGQLSGRIAMGEAIDRAARLVAGGTDADAPSVSRVDRSSGMLPEDDLSQSGSMPVLVSADVRLDDTTAGLLGAAFDVGGDETGLFLRGTALRETPRTLLGKPTPFVGRERELANLLALFEECRTEPVARAVLVTGPAGAGKSRLRRELLDAIRRADDTANVWIARGDPLGEGAPFRMLADALRGAMRIREGEALVVGRRKVVARVGRHFSGDDATRIAAFLGELVGTPFDDEGHPALRAARSDRILMGDQMRRAFDEWLSAECRAHPVVLVLEDLQWGDLPTVHLVDAALRQLETAPLFVVALARPEVKDAFAGLWSERGLLEVRLAPLTRKAAEKLVREAVHEGIDDARFARMFDLSGGNAFYLEELIRAHAEGREELPETVLAMVQARLAELDTGARRVLRAGAILGRVFSREALEALVGTHDGALEESLDELVRRELLLSRGTDEFAFRHSSVREAAYATLTAEDRALGHRLAAAWLETGTDADPLRLAEHFERGGVPERATLSYLRAAERALGGNDFTAAIAHADRAVACGAAGETLARAHLLASEALLWRGDNVAAIDRAVAGLAAAPRGESVWYEVAGALAMATYRGGDFARLRAVAEEAASLEATPSTETPRLVGLARTASRAFGIGALEAGDRLLLQLEEHRSADDAVVAWTHSARAMRAAWLAEAAGEIAELEAAIATFDRIGDTRNACLNRINAGVVLCVVDFVASENVLREAIPVAERLGLHGAVHGARQNLAVALARQRRVEEAVALEERSVEGFHAEGDTLNEGASRLYLAAILRLFDLERAEREAHAGLALLGDAPPMRAAGLAILSRIVRERGRSDDGLTAAREALEILERLGGVTDGETLVHVALAEALHACGHEEEARFEIGITRDALLARAATLGNDAWRRTFLEGISEHADALAHAAAWGVT